MATILLIAVLYALGCVQALVITDREAPTSAKIFDCLLWPTIAAGAVCYATYCLVRGGRK